MSVITAKAGNPSGLKEASGSPLLRLNRVRVAHGSVEALHEVSFSIQEQEIATLLGANGAGKSTTLLAISGLLPCHGGTIEFDGRPINDCAPHDIVQRGISHVPEGRRIFSRLTVLENLLMGAYSRKRDSARQRTDLDRVFGLFPILADRQQQLGGTLSGGEQQMLAIGRGLMSAPRLLLLDEPSLGLAPKVEQVIFEVIRHINEMGTTVLLVEQNANLALRVAHRGYIMETGRITLEDASGKLLKNDQVRQSYLGE